MSALLLTLLALTASQSDKVGWEQDTTGGKGCWRNANTGESYGCDTSAGDKAPGSGQDSDKTWDKTAQPPTMPPRPSLPPGASRSRPKILCLHGGDGNDEGFRMQANSLIQAAPGLEFVFVSAPNSGGLWIPDPPSSGGEKGPPLTPTGILTLPRLWTASYGSKVPFTASSATHRARRTPYHTCPTRRLGRSSWRLSSADTCRARTSGSWQGSTIVCARVAHVASLARCVSRRDREAARIALWLLGARVARQSMRARHAHQ